MIEVVNVFPEDGLKKLRVSCSTLRTIISEAMLIENEDKDRGYSLHAGIAHWVRVPVCECGACASLLADSRRAGRKKRPTTMVRPVINCAAAIRLEERAAAASDEMEEERLLDILDASLIVHQCGNAAKCDVRRGLGHVPAYDEAIEVVRLYDEFRANAPRAAMEFHTKSGSTYHLYYRDGKALVTREHRDDKGEVEDFTEQALATLFRVGNRIVVNDWFTTPVVSSRMIFAIRPRSVADLLAEVQEGIKDDIAKRYGVPKEEMVVEHVDPPWQLVLDEVEEDLDRIEDRMRLDDRLEEADVPDEVLQYIADKDGLDYQLDYEEDVA